jgi:hypothetical protein
LASSYNKDSQLYYDLIQRQAMGDVIAVQFVSRVKIIIENVLIELLLLLLLLLLLMAMMVMMR